MKILPRMVPGHPENKFYRRTRQLNRARRCPLKAGQTTAISQPNYPRAMRRRIAAKVAKRPEPL